MTEDTFLYLWEQGIVKAAKDVVAEISPDLIEKYNVKLNTSDLMYDKLYKTTNASAAAQTISIKIT